MKNYIKGLLSGIIIATVLFSIPAFAENVNVLFNSVRISVDGVEKAQWGENYTLADGTEAPYSIVYNDTTYLSLRKFGEIFNKNVSWNGDTATIYVLDYNTLSNVSSFKIAEKEDSNGNVWEYYNYNNFLYVKDSARDFMRIYKMPSYSKSSYGRDAVRVTDDAIYFAKITGGPTNGYYDVHIQKISFLNDESSQDGEKVESLDRCSSNVIFDGDYIYYVSSNVGGNKDAIVVRNLITGKTAYTGEMRLWDKAYDLTLSKNDVGNAVITYSLGPSNGSDLSFTYKVEVFNDGELRFGEPQKID